MMKHVTIVEGHGYSTLKDKVNEWISENESEILEMLAVEYEQHGEVYLARITYEEK